MDFIKNIFTMLHRSEHSEEQTATTKRGTELKIDKSNNFRERHPAEDRDLRSSHCSETTLDNVSLKLAAISSLQPERTSVYSENATATSKTEVSSNTLEVEESDNNIFQNINFLDNDFPEDHLLISQSVEDTTENMLVTELVNNTTNMLVHESSEKGILKAEKIVKLDEPIIDLDEFYAIFNNLHDTSVSVNEASDANKLVKDENINKLDKSYDKHTITSYDTGYNAAPNEAIEKPQYFNEFEKFIMEYNITQNTKEEHSVPNITLMEYSDTDFIEFEDTKNKNITEVLIENAGLCNDIDQIEVLVPQFVPNKPEFNEKIKSENKDLYNTQGDIQKTFKIESIDKSNESMNSTAGIISLSSETDDETSGKFKTESDEANLPLSHMASIVSISSATTEELDNDGIKTSNDEGNDSNSDSDGYHSSDFEFITEAEAKLDGLIINSFNKTLATPTTDSVYPTKTKDISTYHSSEAFVEFDPRDVKPVEIHPQPGTSKDTNSPADENNSKNFYSTLRREFEMAESYKRQQTHAIPTGADYLSLFQGIYAPFPLAVSENKSVGQSRCMNVQPRGVGFDMRATGPVPVEKCVYENEAKETVNLILDMYSGENRLRKKRRRHY